MTHPTRWFAALGLAAALALSGCAASIDDAVASTSAETTSASDANEATEGTTTSYVAISDLTELAYEDLGIADFDVETSGSVTVTLADGGTSGAAGVSVDGDTVTVTEGGVYRLTGTLSAGRIVVDAQEDDVTLILDGVDVTSPDVGALLVTNADDVQIYLASGSTNTLADAEGAAVDEAAVDAPNATLYSTADLWIGGPGELIVNAVAEDGITSKDSLVLDGGDVTVTAADDGIRGKDHLVVLSGTVTVNAGGDGLKSDDEDGGVDASATVGVVWMSGGSIDVTAGADGIEGYRQVSIADAEVTVAAGDDGVHTEGFMGVASGTVTVSESYEGLEAAVMVLAGGTISVVASDDGINVSGGPGVESGGGPMGGMGAGGNANGFVPGEMPTRPDRPADVVPGSTDSGDPALDGTGGAETGGRVPGGGGAQGTGFPGAGSTDGRSLLISGGTLLISAGADGLDANADVTMTGGIVVTTSAAAGGGDSSVDVDGTFAIEGGSLVATGLTDQTAAPTTAGQGLLTIGLGDQVSEQTRVTVIDAKGNAVVSYVAEKSMSSLVVSAAGITSGETYTVTTGGTVSGGTSVGTATFGGTSSGAAELGTLAAS
ncbi:carbohydrate-binding domain-containing protein [Demequina sp. TTPB684]|uniref:carbohydrate-binding domain-containing protein n=1 Tax=unclassified Demequina TaxID=2620311 RepID=UPI001CF5456B|nr:MULTISPECIES: carbohydrate-binding domain-containing protein [unclassified Demequina]MCB2411935.1 carbohydrate-binding domain-containing protein [Demequina sp. TTPB684]UPU88058.1 carbohydrate-binding domain-containing protein [Demequina sp. TMPB413]